MHEDKEQAVVPHPHKSKVRGVRLFDPYTKSLSYYWQVVCPICGDLSLHLTWRRAIIKASDHISLWEDQERQHNKFYQPRNEISNRFTPR